MEWQNLSFLIGNIAGYILKRQPWYDNKFIPGAVFVVAMLTQFLKGVGVPGVVPSAMLAGVSLGATLPLVLWGALTDTIAAVGFHSILKNFKQGAGTFIGKAVVRWLSKDKPA